MTLYLVITDVSVKFRLAFTYTGTRHTETYGKQICKIWINITGIHAHSHFVVVAVDLKRENDDLYAFVAH